MKNINVFIKDNINQVANTKNRLYVAPDIPEKKLNNAASSMELQNHVGSILALLDTTVFGSGKDGFVFTGERMVFKQILSSPENVYFNELESAKYVKNISTNEKGKEFVEEFTQIIRKNGSSFKVENTSECNLKNLADFLNKIITQFDSFEEEDQIISIAEMSEEIKVAYIKIIINMAYSDDGKVDENEFAQILLLMTRLELSSESRFTLREYITSNKLDDLGNLVCTIDNKCLPSHNKLVKISLVKDLFAVFMSVHDGSYEGFDFFDKNKGLFGLNEQEIELIIDTLKLDFKMLNDDLSDNALARNMKELGAKAGAVGVPLAAVYLSGSVVGMSAAGLTSGLATLGLGGVLGFSSMATGIGVAVLLGVGAYKGIKHLTGANELDKTKRRELMLNEVIKQQQLTVSKLMQDINFIAIKLNDTIISGKATEEKVKLLIQKFKLLTSAGGVLTRANEATQSKCFRLKCPSELDQDKLKSLTQEATKQSIYTAIMSFYVEENIEKEMDGKVLTVKSLVLKKDISVMNIEKLAKMFESIGYFNVGSVIKGKLSGFFS